MLKAATFICDDLFGNNEQAAYQPRPQPDKAIAGARTFGCSGDSRGGALDCIGSADAPFPAGLPVGTRGLA